MWKLGETVADTLFLELVLDVTRKGLCWQVGVVRGGGRDEGEPVPTHYDLNLNILQTRSPKLQQ
jgi:hypothetical protein